MTNQKQNTSLNTIKSLFNLKIPILSYRSYFYYFLFILFTTFIYILFQISLSSIQIDLRVFFYLLGVLGYYGISLFLLFSLLYICLFLFHSLAVFFIPVLGTIWGFYLFIDAFVFKLYYFHLDLLLIKMFIFDFKGMGIPFFLIILGFLFFLFFFFSNIFLFRFLIKTNKKANYKIIIFIPIILFFLFLINSTINIWADFYKRAEILNYKSYFPIYYPVIDYEIAPVLSKNFPKIFPPQRGKIFPAHERENSRLYYPKNPLVCDFQNRPNFILIVLESWQSETVNPDNMPRLWTRMQKGGKLYQNHISNGTTTVPGLFSLFTGVYPTYFDSFSTNPQQNGSILIKELVKNGYEIYCFSESLLKRFHLLSLIFPNLKQENYFKTISDEQSLEALKQNLQKRKKDTPFFDMIFYTSSHFNYDYPDDLKYKKYTPIPKIDGLYVFNTATDPTPYKNDYKNSLFYLDEIIDKTLNSYTQKGLLQNTYIFITGDHAEEFNENKLGYWGHGSNFTKWQNLVPFIVIAPNYNTFEKIQNRSFHIDFVPTVLKNIFSCKNPLSDFTNGINLNSLSEKIRNSVISSYYQDAFLIDEVIYEKNLGKIYTWEKHQGVKKSTPNAKAYKEILDACKIFYQK